MFQFITGTIGVDKTKRLKINTYDSFIDSTLKKFTIHMFSDFLSVVWV